MKLWPRVWCRFFDSRCIGLSTFLQLRLQFTHINKFCKHLTFFLRLITYCRLTFWLILSSFNYKHSPCVASPARKPTGGCRGLGGSVHEENHPCFIQLSFKSVDAGSIYTTRWSRWFHLLGLITLFEKKYLQQSRVHRNLTSHLKRLLIPLVLSARVKTHSTLASTAR